MNETSPQLYEGLFLFNIQAISGELQTAVNHLQDILGRAEAEVINFTKWDERRLAYPIAGQKRGLYLLAHFKVRPAQVANIERDVNLSELLLRCLIIKGDHLGETELATYEDASKQLQAELGLRGAGESAPSEDAAAPQAPTEAPPEAAAETDAVEGATADESAEAAEPTTTAEPNEAESTRE